MTNVLDEQPAPIATNRKPVWPIVIAYARANWPLDDDDTPEGRADAALARQVISDMEERHQLGIQRYGVPLTAANGRDALVDAYQEWLDGAVYLATWLDENGVDVGDVFTRSKSGEEIKLDLAPHVQTVFGLFINHTAQLPLLRAVIADRPS